MSTFLFVFFVLQKNVDRFYFAEMISLMFLFQQQRRSEEKERDIQQTNGPRQQNERDKK